MSIFTVPVFGPLDLASGENYFQTETVINGRPVSLDLNFSDSTVDPGRMEVLRSFLGRLNEFHETNLNYMKQDFENPEGDSVRFYLENFIADTPEEELEKLIDIRKKDEEPEEQLLKKLHLIRIGFYPEDQDAFAVFDYSVGEELTNYLVVIVADESGEPAYITVES